MVPSLVSNRKWAKQESWTLKNPAYSNAKGRLPEAPIKELMISVGTEVEGQDHKRDRIFDDPTR